jgi:hypothetical protein
LFVPSKGAHRTWWCVDRQAIHIDFEFSNRSQGLLFVGSLVRW